MAAGHRFPRQEADAPLHMAPECLVKLLGVGGSPSDCHAAACSTRQIFAGSGSVAGGLYSSLRNLGGRLCCCLLSCFLCWFRSWNLSLYLHESLARAFDALELQ